MVWLHWPQIEALKSEEHPVKAHALLVQLVYQN